MEIMIVLAIIGSLLVMGVNLMGSGSTNNMRKVSGELVGLIHYVYNQAALKNEYYRITFDMNEQKYFVEYSDQPFYVVRDDDETEAIRIHNEEKDKDQNDSTEEDTSDSSNNAAQAAALGAFAESEDDLLQIFTLPDNIKFRDVYVMHQKDKLEEGKTYLYFFPRGTTEFAVIHLSDLEGDDSMTLVVNPLTAKVDVIPEYKDYEDILKEQEEGK